MWAAVIGTVFAVVVSLAALRDDPVDDMLPHVSYGHASQYQASIVCESRHCLIRSIHDGDTYQQVRYTPIA